MGSAAARVRSRASRRATCRRLPGCVHRPAYRGGRAPSGVRACRWCGRGHPSRRAAFPAFPSRTRPGAGRRVGDVGRYRRDCGGWSNPVPVVWAPGCPCSMRRNRSSGRFLHRVDLPGSILARCEGSIRLPRSPRRTSRVPVPAQPTARVDPGGPTRAERPPGGPEPDQAGWSLDCRCRRTMTWGLRRRSRIADRTRFSASAMSRCWHPGASGSSGRRCT